MKFVEEYIGLTGQGQVELSDAIEISDKIIKTFIEDEEIDKVFLVFTEFKTVMSQFVKVEQLLPIPPISATEGEEETGAEAEYIYEQRPLKFSENCCQNKFRRKSIGQCSNRSPPSKVHG